MQNDIRDKLKSHLRSEIDSEPAAVYLLVQARKLMETEQAARRADSLRLCCNWVAHVALENPTAQRLVAVFNREEEFSGIRMPPLELIAAVNFSRFSEELHQLLRDHGIETAKLTGQAWTRFMSHFVKVIRDCPLRVPVGTGSTASIVVDAEEVAHPDEGQMLAIRWTVHRHDQRPGSIHVTQHRL